LKGYKQQKIITYTPVIWTGVYPHMPIAVTEPEPTVSTPVCHTCFATVRSVVTPG